MSSCCSSSNRALAACPNCGQPGSSVEQITPQHTLRLELRGDIALSARYYFCETPECNHIYFSEDGKQRFSSAQLINRVTCKDPSPDTPLCYCFKITKGDVLKEYQVSGESSVITQIEGKMADKPCFCDKSNPRGLCCTTEIKSWLKSQGIEESENISTDSSCC